MNKKINLLGLLFFLSFASLKAQMSYYYQGEQVKLTVNRSFVHIIADEDLIKSSSSNQLFQRFNIELDDSNQVQNMVKLKLKSVPEMQEYSKIVEVLKQNEQIKYVFPFFERGDAPPIGTSDIFYVKLKEITDTTLLKKIAEEQNVQIVKQVPYMPFWYILSVQNSNLGNSIIATNYFFETGHFEDVDPAFMFNFKPNCTNDPMFNQLWGLKNTSYQGIDIDACNAWTITRGAGINVAVLDQGIDPNHNDLKANFHSLSFNTQPYQLPYYSYLGHGTHVAGTIAAVRNNNLQVVGIAPESKIMRVSHDLSLTPNVSAELASGISWAWQNGADVINNSWGDQGGWFYNELYSSILNNAILNAMSQGRNGKGSIVVFAAGNWAPDMDYPATYHDDILTVGAINSSGVRSSFSAYGTKLDVVAPGDDILSTLPGNSADYDGGTSMAAPHVAGVSALVLSVNPNLKGRHVRNIIESTTQALSSYPPNNPSRPNWNNQVGYGLVNAYDAVQKAVACATTTVNFTGTITTPITVTADTTIVSCGNINVQYVTVTNNATLTLEALGNIDIQDMIVINNSALILDATGEVTIHRNFEVELGSELDIKYP